ncbi:MAG: CAP domain-containing protein [Candidatus Paceibacterota bacterium]
MPRKKDIKDSDSDGLIDSLEEIRGTNPEKMDTDGDGVGDYQEINVFGTNPVKRDTDDDGMSDGDEIKSGRNPFGPGQLKDLFIPYEGNDYKPQALNPYRILFYTITSVAIKIFVVLVVFMFPLSALLVPSIIADQNKKIVELTNEIRARVGVPPLKESKNLDLAADQKAEDMLMKQYFAHQGPDKKAVEDWLKSAGYKYLVAGENLAMGFSSPEEVVDGWTRSKTHYENMIDPDFSEIGVGMVVGSFDKTDTTLIAQYFGRPTGEKMNIENRPKTASKEITAKPLAVNSSDKKVLGVKKFATDITVDKERTKLYVEENIAGDGGKLIKAVAYLGADVVDAQVHFGGYAMQLRPDLTEAGRWAGDMVIFKENVSKVFEPLILPSIEVSDVNGNKIETDIDWANPPVIKPSLFKQYSLMKQYKSVDLRNLFLVSSLYYKVLLLIALAALALNSFIEVRRQYPRMIFSAIGFIILLLILILV